LYIKTNAFHTALKDSSCYKLLPLILSRIRNWRGINEEITTQGKTMKKIIVLTSVIAMLSGCAMSAPSYTPSVSSIQAIKSSGSSSVAVTKTSVAKPALNKISLRGTTLKSPTGDYATYLEQALKKELSDAGLLDEKSDTVINTTLTKNQIDTGMAQGTGNIAAIFSVTKAGNKVFEKEIAVTEVWESSFVGAIAIPNAVNAYPTLVNKLITNLFSDKEFLAAISK
jgi:hypothetical protein